MRKQDAKVKWPFKPKIRFGAAGVNPGIVAIACRLSPQLPLEDWIVRPASSSSPRDAA
jgi:hypothetical protein